jgi:hypothetical protein
MKLKIKITESQLEDLRSNYSTLNKSELGKNFSADYHVNKKSGKDPYIKKGFLFIKLDSDKSIPKDCYYFTEEDATELNQMGQDLEALKVAYDSKLKSLTGGNKKKED